MRGHAGSSTHNKQQQQQPKALKRPPSHSTQAVTRATSSNGCKPPAVMERIAVGSDFCLGVDCDACVYVWGAADCGLIVPGGDAKSLTDVQHAEWTQ